MIFEYLHKPGINFHPWEWALLPWCILLAQVLAQIVIICSQRIRRTNCSQLISARSPNQSRCQMGAKLSKRSAPRYHWQPEVCIGINVVGMCGYQVLATCNLEHIWRPDPQSYNFCLRTCPLELWKVLVQELRVHPQVLLSGHYLANNHRHDLPDTVKKHMEETFWAHIRRPVEECNFPQ